MAERFACIVAMMVLSVSVAGCQEPSVPSVSPVPSWRCTPEAGGAEYDCSEYQHWEMVGKDKLYAEAEAVYRKFFVEDERVFRAGGVSRPTAVLLETTAGDFLDDSMDYYKMLRETESKFVGGEYRLVALLRVPGVSKSGSVVAMKACFDASSTTLVVKGKNAGKGHKGSDLLYFGRFGSQLKIIGADGKKGDTCEQR